MLHFTWSESYAIGLPDIDAQHRVILHLAERIQEQHEAGLSGDGLIPLFEEVQLFLQYHLATEEQMMQIYAYPDILSHKRDHAEVLCDLGDRIRRYLTGDLSLNKVILFIVGWFVGHSTHVDRKYVPWVLQRRRELGLLYGEDGADQA